MTTFVDDVLAGRTSLDAVDDYVDRWHDGDGEGSLHAFLGLSWDEYGAWVKDPNAMGRLVAERGAAQRRQPAPA